MTTAYAKPATSADNFSAAREQMETMITELSTSTMLSAPHSDIESYVQTEGREVLRQLLQGHLDLRAERERPVPVRGSDGIARTYRRESHRPLGSILGPVLVWRLAYQAPKVDGLHPMDASLNLPPTLYSHGVCRFIAEHAARMSFDDVVHEVEISTGASVAKRQAEEIAVHAAIDFEAFYAKRRSGKEMDEATTDFLVLTFDGKGIVMVPRDLRPATQKAAQKTKRKLVTRLTSGEKRNRKRMAEVAAVYTVPPYVRTPFEVLADLSGDEDEVTRRARRARRPKVSNKRVFASVEQDPAVVIEEAFRDALARDPKRQRRWVVLLDGNKDQLALTKAAAAKFGVEITIIVDLIHVLEYLWKAAHAFYDHNTQPGEAEAWVQQREMWLLQGRHAGKVATAMRQAARAANLTSTALEAVHDAADYLQSYARYLRYDQALALGMPIATGIIEGACRYLIKDRMDRGGVQWTLDGAEAVLRLRALWASGDFDAYWDFHLKEELRRNHVEHYALGRVPDPIRPLKMAK